MRWLRFASFWVYPLLAATLLVLAGLPGPPPVLLLALGLGLWTLVEYGLHRFVFHWRPENRRLKRFLAGLHLRHHGDPRNVATILIRPKYSLSVSTLIFAGLWSATGDFATAAWVMVGSWTGFLYYETVHYRVHRSKRAGGLLDFQRRSHFHHHFVDDERCFGVTSPLWDLVFGTYGRTERPVAGEGEGVK